MAIYLKITGIDGDSTAKGFEKQFGLSSYSWGASVPISAGGTPGKSTFESFEVQRIGPGGNTKLMLACATGQNLKTITITVTKTQAAGNEVVSEVYTLDNAFICSLHVSADNGSAPSDTIDFVFSKITYAVTTYSNTGVGTTVSNNWDIALGKGG